MPKTRPRRRRKTLCSDDLRPSVRRPQKSTKKLDDSREFLLFVRRVLVVVVQTGVDSTNGYLPLDVISNKTFTTPGNLLWAGVPANLVPATLTPDLILPLGKFRKRIVKFMQVVFLLVVV